jgi:uncharacterized protein
VSNEIVCEIRCPIHGFIGLNAWEKSLVDTEVFQRLRRIRQLAWTDYVYPGAMHTRFEHSLGVMHVATLLFDSIVKNSKKVLFSAYDYDEHGIAKERQKIRLAALLHDVVHPPFSHASEDVFPPVDKRQGNSTEVKRYKHEEYSYGLIRNQLRESIEEHSANKNYDFKAEDITSLLEGNAEAGHSLFWRDLLAHQLDADRMDYLLRDSHHLGVNYGKYDLHRLVSSVCAYETSGQDQDTRRIRIGVYNGGLHAAESLIIARYSMFKQVYFHKTRMAFDIHLHHVMSSILPGGCFSPPDASGLDEYLKWDDWRVLGLMAAGGGGPHAARMLNRNHYRQVYRSKDMPQSIEEVLGGEKRKAEWLQSKLAGMEVELKTSKNNWYKVISIVNENNPKDIRPLSEYSPIASLNAGHQYFLYVKQEDFFRAREIIESASAELERHPSLADEPQAPEEASKAPNADESSAMKKPASSSIMESSQQKLSLTQKDGPDS